MRHRVAARTASRITARCYRRLDAISRRLLSGELSGRDFRRLRATRILVEKRLSVVGVAS